LLQAALDASSVALWHTELASGKVFLSRAWSAMLGLPAAETMTTVQELQSLVHPRDLPCALELAVQTMKGLRGHYEVEHRVRTATGGWRWILSRGMVTRRDPRTGRALEMAGTNVDIHSRREAEEALLKSEQRLRVITDHIPGLIAYVDSHLVYRFVNKTHEKWLGLTREEVTGRSMFEVLGAEVFASIRPYAESALRGEVAFCEFDIDCGGGTRHVQSTHVPDIDLSGTCRGFYVLSADVSLLKETQKRLLHEAQHDPLTGIANRRLLEDRLAHAIAMARRKGWALGLLFMDVDDFKQINDTHGHAVGDETLIRLAHSLRRSIKNTDTVARLGGDEFIVVLEDVRSYEMAVHVAEKLLANVRRPMHVKDRSLVVTMSVGIALLEEGETAAQFIARGDAALYAAKRRDGERRKHSA
jgi:diguanylate cyclase (GGDEF)-like protein/PAS domain S-box-containing protein